MIKIGILGDIGSGKSFVAKNFGHPVFNADYEVYKLYKKDKKIFNKLKKKLPKHISLFPIDKKQISNAILANKSNLKKIVKVVHQEVGKKIRLFLNKNKNNKIVILDISLLLENKINSKRENYNQKILNKFKKIQLPLDYKRKKSQFIIKNKFTKKSVKLGIKNILKEIL